MGFSVSSPCPRKLARMISVRTKRRRLRPRTAPLSEGSRPGGKKQRRKKQRFWNNVQKQRRNCAQPRRADAPCAQNSEELCAHAKCTRFAKQHSKCNRQFHAKARTHLSGAERVADPPARNVKGVRLSFYPARPLPPSLLRLGHNP